MKKYKILILIALVASVLLSGCIEKQIDANQTKMANKELINSFCQAKGYDWGATEIQDHSSYIAYDKEATHNGFVTDVDRTIICSKTTYSKEYNTYDYTEMFKWLNN